MRDTRNVVEITTPDRATVEAAEDLLAEALISLGRAMVLTAMVSDAIASGSRHIEPVAPRCRPRRSKRRRPAAS